jgi:hypothetical protein
VRHTAGETFESKAQVCLDTISERFWYHSDTGYRSRKPDLECGAKHPSGCEVWQGDRHSVAGPERGTQKARMHF